MKEFKLHEIEYIVKINASGRYDLFRKDGIDIKGKKDGILKEFLQKLGANDDLLSLYGCNRRSRFVYRIDENNIEKSMEVLNKEGTKKAKKIFENQQKKGYK